MKSFEDMGLAVWGHSLVYGWKHGRLRWAPMWVKRLIVAIWNPIACRVWGHDVFGPFEKGDKAVCVNCCKKFPRRAP